MGKLVFSWGLEEGLNLLSCSRQWDGLVVWEVVLNVFCSWGCPWAEMDWCLLSGGSVTRFEGGGLLGRSQWQVWLWSWRCFLLFCICQWLCRAVHGWSHVKVEKKVVEVPLEETWHVEGGRKPEGLVPLCCQHDSEHMKWKKIYLKNDFLDEKCHLSKKAVCDCSSLLRYDTDIILQTYFGVSRAAQPNFFFIPIPPI